MSAAREKIKQGQLNKAFRLLQTNEPKRLDGLYYSPSSKVATLLKTLGNYRKKKTPSPVERQKAGYVLEALAVATFSAMSGCTEILSYRGAMAQIDLLVSGDTDSWERLWRLCRGTPGKPSIIVEAKATASKVNDATFARLCALVSHNFAGEAGLGVFFTLEGATGFPQAGDSAAVLKLSEARLRQALFHAKTSVPVVVLAWSDIEQLARPGSLIRILRDKVGEIERMTGLPTSKVAKLRHCLLPPHLAPYAKARRKKAPPTK